jgi:hypothetical protein
LACGQRNLALLCPHLLSSKLASCRQKKRALLHRILPFTLLIHTCDAQEKLALLYRKSLFPTALSLAASRRLGPATLARIHAAYAEHLYAKGDYAAAAEQYVPMVDCRVAGAHRVLTRGWRWEA